jgi:hypothetical protein
MNIILFIYLFFEELRNKIWAIDEVYNDLYFGHLVGYYEREADFRDVRILLLINLEVKC